MRCLHSGLQLDLFHRCSPQYRRSSSFFFLFLLLTLLLLLLPLLSPSSSRISFSSSSSFSSSPSFFFFFFITPKQLRNGVISSNVQDQQFTWKPGTLSYGGSGVFSLHTLCYLSWSSAGLMYVRFDSVIFSLAANHDCLSVCYVS